MLVKYGRVLQHKGAACVFDGCYRLLMALSSLCVLLAVWQVASVSLGDFVLPEPLAVGKYALFIVQHHSDNIVVSLRSGLTGTTIAIFVGVFLGGLSGFFPVVCALLRPWNTVLLGTPPIIWVVLAFFWFGTQVETVVTFTVVISVAPMLFSAGMMSMETRPQSLHEMAAVYRLSLYKRLRYLYLPHLMITLMPALIVAVSMGIKVTVMAELLVSSRGIGGAISGARETLETTELVAYVLVAILMIITLEYGVLNPLRRLVLPRGYREQT